MPSITLQVFQTNSLQIGTYGIVERLLAPYVVIIYLPGLLLNRMKIIVPPKHCVLNTYISLSRHHYRMFISQHESRDENQAAERVAPLNPRMRNMAARRIDMMLANIFLTRETILFCDWFGILVGEMVRHSHPFPPPTSSPVFFLRGKVMYGRPFKVNTSHWPSIIDYTHIRSPS